MGWDERMREREGGRGRKGREGKREGVVGCMRGRVVGGRVTRKSCTVSSTKSTLSTRPSPLELLHVLMEGLEATRTRIVHLDTRDRSHAGGINKRDCHRHSLGMTMYILQGYIV